jgi:hypothetical protein
MPTDPLPWLLDRDLSKVAAKEVIELTSSLLTEIANYGTTVFGRCMASAKGEPNEDLATLLLYLHVVEMTDGIQVLVGECCPTPAEPLLRSAFEALLSLRYIVRDDYRHRSLAWLADYTRSRLAEYDLADSETAHGGRFREALRREGRNIPLPENSEVRAAAAKLQPLLQSDQFREVVAEFDTLRRQRRRHPAWYSLFGGPQTLRQLAVTVQMETMFSGFYPYWSRVAHAQDARRFLGVPRDGRQGFNRLRNTAGIRQLASLATSVFLDGTQALLGHFRPDEKVLGKWYKAEVQVPYMALSGPVNGSQQA